MGTVQDTKTDASDILVLTDRDIIDIDRAVRGLAVVGVVLAAITLVVAAFIVSTEVAVAGVAVATAALLAPVLWRMSGGRPGWFVPRWTVVELTTVVILSLAVPELLPAFAAAALIPVAVAMPFTTPRALAGVMIAAFAVCTGLAVLAELVPPRSGVPEWALTILRVEAIAGVIGVLLGFLWYYRGRLAQGSRDATSVMALSRDLAETLDPHEIGERLARHLAEATGADHCVISSWDRTHEAVVGFAAFPPAAVERLEESYPLSQYPLTRRVIEQRHAVSLHIDDPDADPNEVAVLTAAGDTALVMVPLVAKGQPIGLIELSRKGDRFSERVVSLASMFASEAAMALENARLYQELRYQAFHDAVTRLPNRALFTDRLAHALARSRRRGSLLSVLFLDIDDFKTINDRLGHARGDLVLTAVADRLRLCVREADTAARLGGDEFALLLEDLVSRAEAMEIADRVLDMMSRPIQLPDSTVGTSVSIGVAFPGTGGETADDLLRNADFAMYRAKTTGKGRVEVFQPSLRETAAERRRLEVMLNEAIERDEFRLEYQPVVDLTDGRLVGVEALVRWHLSDGRTRMPAEFIEMAEETGLIVPIGRWVLGAACHQIRAWQSMTGSPLSVAVNLSARQFQHPGLRKDVREALRDSGLAPESLVVEITESTLMVSTPGTIAALGAMQDAGIRVAVDDFGTGYSSLSYLQRFPIDILKLDRSFVDGTSHDNGVLARAIVELGRALRMSVIAEGIETIRQLAALRAFGCRFGQGYLFAPPMTAEEMERVVVGPQRPWDRLWQDGTIEQHAGNDAWARHIVQVPVKTPKTQIPTAIPPMTASTTPTTSRRDRA